MKQRRGRFLVCAATLLVAVPASGQEREDNVRFAWVRDEGAETCPDATVVRRAVSDRVGRDPFSERARTSIDAIVRRNSQGFVARFFVRGASDEPLGTREFTSAAPTCEPIVEALALALAIVIDPTVALRPEPLVSTSIVRASVTPSPIAAVPRRSPSLTLTALPTSRSQMALALSLSFDAALGVLPTVGFGPALDAHLRFSRWIAADLSSRWLAEQRTSTALSDYALSMASSSASVCVDPLGSTSASRASFAACAALSAGAISASALRQRAIEGGVRPWVALGPALRGQLRVVGPLVLEARLGATFALARNAYLEESGEPVTSATVFEQPLVGGYASLGFGVATEPFGASRP
ncbi:MAG: hypothetical protein JNK05_33710 [Myxococcales bacterium]|nr:hypothetical protein [Myxococcales bacterium]